MNMKLEMNGLIAAGFSPFHLDGSVNLKPIPKLVDTLIDSGIKGFYLMGSTGEGLSITIGQRKEITEAYIEAIGNRVPVIVNVSHTSYEVSRDLTAHALKAKADAVSATLPAYYAINTLDQLTYAIQKVADCQDEIPFIYYHIPGKTGLNFKMHSFLDNLGNKLPQLGGIKYTSGTIDDFMICQKLHGERYKMFFGVDELFLPALATGVDCFIGSTYNFMLPLYQKIVASYGANNKEEAIAYYFKVSHIINSFLRYDGLASQKAIMKMIGHDFGPPQSPLLPLNKMEFDNLQLNLKEIGYFDYTAALKS